MYSGAHSEQEAQSSTDNQVICVLNNVFLHEVHGVNMLHTGLQKGGKGKKYRLLISVPSSSLRNIDNL